MGANVLEKYSTLLGSLCTPPPKKMRKYGGSRMLHSFASTLSQMDEALLKDSSHTFVSSKLSGEFVVICIKSIKSIIGMIPHCLKRPSGTTEDCFFLLEKPGLDVSQLGISYNVYQDEDDQDADIEQ